MLNILNIIINVEIQAEVNPQMLILHSVES